MTVVWPLPAGRENTRAFIMRGSIYEHLAGRYVVLAWYMEGALRDGGLTE